MAPGKSWFARLFSSDKGQRGIAAPHTWTKGQLLLDDFEVERVLGEGGMGAVYLVRSRSTEQVFAVKTILASRLGDPASQRLFFDELQTWIDLPEHPHLTACRFFRTVGEQVAIFAEYVARGTLATWIEKRKITDLEWALDKAIQFAWGLDAAHELGVIHQDVKPGNVLISAQGLVKITDFGLARARAKAGERSVGRSGQSLLVSYGGLTPAYCSPEQADGRPLSRRTDVWSWGLSVLEMFTGGVTWAHGIFWTWNITPRSRSGAAGPSGSGRATTP
jgi:serine/threonine protein kinase